MSSFNSKRSLTADSNTNSNPPTNRSYYIFGRLLLSTVEDENDSHIGNLLKDFLNEGTTIDSLMLLVRGLLDEHKSVNNGIDYKFSDGATISITAPTVASSTCASASFSIPQVVTESSNKKRKLNDESQQANENLTLSVNTELTPTEAMVRLKLQMLNLTIRTHNDRVGKNPIDEASLKKDASPKVPIRWTPYVNSDGFLECRYGTRKTIVFKNHLESDDVMFKFLHSDELKRTRKQLSSKRLAEAKKEKESSKASDNSDDDDEEEESDEEEVEEEAEAGEEILADLNMNNNSDDEDALFEE